jgi:Gpi18-like mannosyltransferase
LGRLPVDSYIKTPVMLYYSRIQSDGINPLVKKAFNINKNISNENIYTWYTFTTEIFKEVELNKNNFEDFNKPFLLVKDTFKNMFKKTIKEKYLKKYQT